MNTITWGLALGTFVPILSSAAGIETSNQSIQSFLESDHYVELTYAQVHANVSGQLPQTEALKQQGVENFSTGNLINDQYFFNVAAKLQLTPQLSFGLIYDHPYGMDMDYQYQPQLQTGAPLLESGKLDFSSENISLLFGYQPSSQWNIYAGTAYQQFQGELEVMGENYSTLSGYHAKIKKSAGQGWLVGLSYQIPEYAFKTALTYRSKIEHKASITEDLYGQNLEFVPFAKTTINTPQSVNLDFQTGLSQHNYLYSTLRWVNWKDFKIQPTQFGTVIDYYVSLYPTTAKPFNLVEYKSDQWSAKLGLAHKFSEHWIGAAEMLWDSGTDNPAGTLNPSNGYYGLGIGAVYKPDANYYLAYGINYIYFNKADLDSLNPFNSVTQNSTLSGVNNNYAFVHGIKFGYHF